MNQDIKFHVNDYFYDRVSRNIKKYRTLADLTQQQLADIAGITMGYVSQIESKKIKKGFTIEVVGLIADALKIDISKLFEPNENE